MESILLRKKENGTSYLIGGNGPAVLFLHGQPGSSERWRKVGTALSRHYTVIAPDLPGFGESEPPPESFSFEYAAQKVNALLKKLRVDNVFVAGHDIGVPVALTLIRSFHDLKINGVMISNALVFKDTFQRLPPLVKLLMFLTAPLQKNMLSTRKGIEGWYSRMVFNKSAFPLSELMASVTPTSMVSHRLVMSLYLKNFESTFEGIERTAHNLACPVFIAWGGKDPVATEAIAHRLEKMIPSSRKKIYECGHMVQEECAESLASDLKGFLSDSCKMV